MKITIEQIEELYDNLGDIKFVDLSQNEEGNLVVKFDGLEDESIIIDEEGDIL